MFGGVCGSFHTDPHVQYDWKTGDIERMGGGLALFQTTPENRALIRPYQGKGCIRGSYGDDPLIRPAIS